jgi:hypothetical protein
MPPIPFANCNAAPISPARMSKKHEPGLLLHWEPAVQTWRVDDCLPDGCMPRSVSWPRVFQRNRKVSFLHGTLQWGLLVVTCELRIALALLFLAHSHIGGVALCSCSLKAGSPIFFFLPFFKKFFTYSSRCAIPNDRWLFVLAWNETNTRSRLLYMLGCYGNKHKMSTRSINVRARC